MAWSRLASLLFIPLAGEPAAAAHPPVVLPGTEGARRVLTRAEEKVETRLRAAMAPESSPQAGLVTAPLAGQRGTEVRVSVRLGGTGPDDLARLAATGLRIGHVDEEQGLVEGWVPAENVPAMAALDVVRVIHAVRPGRLRTGSVTTKGDAASRADLARATGFDGTGVEVGVISDGIASVAQSIGTGDLPAGTGVPAGCSGACDPARSTCDEGTALLEIVHDLAPGATLTFSSAATAFDFVDSVNCLANAGAKVIVDDLGFYDEPFFEDGRVARAVRAAVQRGVSYHSAAGNDAQSHYQATFRATAGNAYHDFLGGPVDNLDGMLVAPGDTLDCILQWTDAFGASANDYDLELFDLRNPQSPRLVSTSTNRQTGTQDPIEELVIVNTGAATADLAVAIRKVSGTDRLLGLFCLTFASPPAQYVTPAGSIFGHAAVETVVAVGAIDTRNDPGLDRIEPYSSQGPVGIYHPAAETRGKPDVMGFDDVSTSVPGFTRFSGTSAAAPHAAAVAALLLGKNGCQTPAQIQAALRATAVDIGAPGFDPVAGAGRLEALAAIRTVPPASCAADSECNDGDPCTTDSCRGCVCVHEPTSCDDGNPCTTDGCEPARGCVHGTAADGAPCPDGDVCDGDETCVGGVCTAGTPLACTAAPACSSSLCDAGSGCFYPPIEGPAGVACLCRQDLATAGCGTSLPAVTVRRFRMGCHRVARAGRARTKRRARRLVGSAERQFAKTMRSVTRASERGVLSGGCAASIAARVADALGRTTRL